MKKLKKNWNLFFILTLLTLITSFPISFAQISNPQGSFIITPEYPEPFDNVTITLETFSFDADRALMTWKINGKVVLSGYGEKSLRTKLGGEGSSINISLSAKLAEGGLYNSEARVSPAYVGLIWEAYDSYVPPFYKGKALPGEGASIRVVALPSLYSKGKRFDPKSISYKWSMNGENSQAASGLGKQSFISKLNYLENENEIKVITTSLDGSQGAESRLTVIPNEIVPRFYIKDPLHGTNYTKAITGSAQINKETIFVFEPYFISGTNLNSPSFNFRWALDGLPVSPDSNNVITISPRENSKGRGALSVSVNQSSKYLQELESALQIIFDTTR